MIKKAVPWIICSVVIVALLAGAYFIIEKDRLAGSERGTTPAFYGH